VIPDFSLYLIVDSHVAGARSCLDIIRKALDGGVTMLQLREKTMPRKEFLSYAHEVTRLSRAYRVPLIINDDVALTWASDADGVHLGQSDLPIEESRRLLGKDRIIGVSVHTVEEARSAESAGADYVGSGAVFPTGSKSDIRGIIGVEGLSRIREAVNIPVVAIGGISRENAAQVMQTGVNGVAILSAILTSDDPLQETRILSQIVHSILSPPK
jgi:thiamine-phosphate pyrophosphorylase